MKVLLMMLFTLFSLAATASPREQLNLYGEGEMKVLFWRVYHAKLYGGSQQYTPATRPLALELTYLRDIKKQELIDATIEQWQHLEAEYPQQNSWAKKLAQIWPDIREGHQLTLVLDQQSKSQFYQGDKLLGQISDPEFGPAFLSIWLSLDTSRPKLRKALIGATP